MTKEQILDKLNDMLTADQVNTDADDLCRPLQKICESQKSTG